MGNFKYLSITGFYGTGSSAIIDLLSNHPNFELNPTYPYEHVLLYNPDSIFDLEWKLLYNNDIHRCDEAIKSFVNEVNRLKQNFGWFGSYNKLFGLRFDSIVEKYIISLIDYEHRLISYKDYKKIRFSFTKLLLQVGAHIVKKRKIYSYGRQYVYFKGSSIQYGAHPSKDHFYNSSKQFITDYASLFHNRGITIFDHLVLPNHLDRIDKFFDDDFGFVVVNRDPRDLFILSKYIYKSKNPFPNKVDDFVKYYKQIRQSFAKNSRVLEVSFEDLIYHNKETKDKLFSFCGVDNLEYDSNFYPNKSINNTQVFLLSEKWKDEINVIESQLKEYLYCFPFQRKPTKEGIFE